MSRAPNPFAVQKEKPVEGSDGLEQRTTQRRNKQPDCTRFLEFTQLKSTDGKQNKELLPGATELVADVHPLRTIGIKRRIANVAELVDVFRGFTEQDALMCGTYDTDTAYIVTTSLAAQGDAFSKKNTNGRVYTRTKECAQFVGSGLVPFDMDFKQEVASLDEVVAELRRLHPILEYAAILAKPSSSSYLLGKGLKGVHAYIGVHGMDYVNRFAELLEVEEWAAGAGWIKFSSNGSILPRAFCDFAVYQTNRVMFEAPVTIHDAAIREEYTEAAKPVYYSPTRTDESGNIADKHGNLYLANYIRYIANPKHEPSKLPFDDLVQASKTAQATKSGKIRDARPESRSRRMQWALEKGLHERTTTKLDMLEKGMLPYHFQLVMLSQPRRTVTVAEILANPQAFHGKRFADPMDDSYNSANLFADADGTVKLWDNHSQVQYQLCDQTTEPYLLDCNMANLITDVIPAVLQAVRDINGDRVWQTAFGLFYQGRDGQVASISNEEALPRLYHDLIELAKVDKEGDKAYFKPSKAVNKAVLANVDDNSHIIPMVDAFTPCPLVIDGAVRQSGIHRRDRDTVIKIHQDWHLDLDRYDSEHYAFFRDKFFAGFRFQGQTPEEQAEGLRRAIITWLTALACPSAEFSPAAMITAYDAGSGKSAMVDLMERCISGRRLSSVPTEALNNKEEFEKRVADWLSGKEAILCFDNLGRGQSIKQNDMLQSMITTGSVKARKMYTGTSPQVRVGKMIIVTGNNIRLGDDDSSRFIVVPLVASDREAGEHMNTRPESLRQEAVARGMRLLCARYSDPNRTADQSRFPTWEAFIRPALRAMGLPDNLDFFAEQKLDNAERMATEELIAALAEAAQGEFFTSQDVLACVRFSEVRAMLGTVKSARGIGNVLTSHKGQHEAGFLMPFRKGCRSGFIIK